MPLTNLQNIAVIMRANRWLNGARLMEIWFSRPFKRKPDYGPSDIDTINLDKWLLTFPRAQKAYQTIFDKKIWTSEAAQKVLANQLQRSGIFSVHLNAQWSFGNLGLPVEQLHPNNMNHVAVSELVPTLDDLTAALANFSLYIAVAGFVRKASTRRNARPKGAPRSRALEGGRGGWPGYEVTVTEVAVWMMDSYDFEGDQDLGWWDEQRNSVLRGPLPDSKYYTQVTNKKFRDWQDQNSKGGDFLVFSDKKIIRLPRPDELFLPPA
jgi:hypothetical protein